MTNDEQGFTPHDFTKILSLTQGLPVIGGQAVAWWANHFEIENEIETPITSRDLDLWADRSEVEEFAKTLAFSVQYPHEYDMTVLSGIARCTIKNRPTQIEFLKNKMA